MLTDNKGDYTTIFNLQIGFIFSSYFSTVLMLFIIINIFNLYTIFKTKIKFCTVIAIITIIVISLAHYTKENFMHQKFPS